VGKGRIPEIQFCSPVCWLLTEFAPFYVVRTRLFVFGERDRINATAAKSTETRTLIIKIS
jgi:hypothetical protein